ncbi:MAG: ABC transporter substrate-binding protein [Deltaproteobacteria bacterium]|nr:ABC transporter substrate-binding protein [Deltaproteobacteria bacterium]
MLIRNSRAFPLLLACGILFSTVPAAADGAEAETRVRQANERLRELLRDTPDAAEIGELVDGLLDYEGLAQRALSTHWDRLTQAQKDEFLNLFKALVAKSYRDNLKDTLDNIAIDFLGWEQTTADSVVVKTKVRKLQTRRNRRAEIAIHYEMRLVSGTWKMIDVTTDGVSLVQSYRDSFNNIIGGAQTFEAGWADLIGRMRRKLDGE